MLDRPTRSRLGFSLVELVIVVVILGTVSAIAIPRMSRAAQGSGETSLVANLSTLRRAIELYRVEHDGLKPLDAKVSDQLLGFTDINGTVSPDGTPSSVYSYGPYLHRLPPLPIGTRKGNTDIHWTDAPGVGWLYSELNFTMKAHASGEFDTGGNEYSTY